MLDVSSILLSIKNLLATDILFFLSSYPMKVRGSITTSHNPFKRKSRPRTFVHLHIYSFKFIYVYILYIETYTIEHVHISFDKTSRGVRGQYLIFYEYIYGNINNF